MQIDITLSTDPSINDNVIYEVDKALGLLTDTSSTSSIQCNTNVQLHHTAATATNTNTNTNIPATTTTNNNIAATVSTADDVAIAAIMQRDEIGNTNKNFCYTPSNKRKRSAAARPSL